MLRLLNELDQCCEEINIYDTGSTDRSEEICVTFKGNSKINFIKGEWRYDFSWARNKSFSYATQDYILWIDADNSLTQELINTINDLKKNDFYNNDIISAYQKNKFFVNIKHFIIKRDTNPYWRYQIHEELTWDNTDRALNMMAFEKSSNNIMDLQQPDVEQLERKIIRNFNIYKKCFENNVKFDAVMWYHYAKTVNFLYDIGKSEVYDGYIGYIDAYKKAISAVDIHDTENNLIFLLSCQKLAYKCMEMEKYKDALRYAKLATCTSLVPRNDVSKIIADAYLMIDEIPDDKKIEESCLWYRHALDYWVSGEEITFNMNSENLLEFGKAYDELQQTAIEQICRLSEANGRYYENLYYTDLLKLKYPDSEYIKNLK